MKRNFTFIYSTLILFLSSCIGTIEKYNEFETELERKEKTKDSTEFYNLIGNISGLKLDSTVRHYELFQHEFGGNQFLYLVKYKGDSTLFKKLCDNLTLSNHKELLTDSVSLNHKKLRNPFYRYFWCADSLNTNMKQILTIYKSNGEVDWWDPASMDSSNCLGYYYTLDTTYTYGYVDRSPKRIGKKIYRSPMGRILCSLQNGYIYIFIDTSNEVW